MLTVPIQNTETERKMLIERITELEADVCPSWMGKEKGCNEAQDVEKLENKLKDEFSRGVKEGLNQAAEIVKSC